MVIGGLGGLVVGIVLGGSRFMSRAYESFLYYLGPCPKIIFFPIMIMWFGVGPASKVAMGRYPLLPGGVERGGRHARDRPGPDPRRPELSRQYLADGDQDLYFRPCATR